MGYLDNIRKQYWISFFRSLIPAYVIERLFWQQRGMDVRMVVYAEIIFALTVTVIEVPSGILADKFGRKRMLCADGILSAAEFIILLFANNFLYFAAAVFLTGIGKAFSSGSENALLYDSLSTEGKQEDFEKHLGRLSAIDFTGSIIAAVSGGVLANYFSFEFNYILSVVSMCIAFIITLSLKEPVMHTKPEYKTAGAIQYIKQALKIFRDSRLVLIYCLTGAVIGSCIIYLDEFWQTLMESIKVPLVFFGLISAVSLTVRIPGNLLAYRLIKKFRYENIFTFIIGLCSVCFASIFITRNILCLVPVTVLFALSGITDPIVMGYLHSRSDSRIRATAESFSSLGLRIISVSVGLLFGYVSTEYSVFTGYLTLGIICAAYLFFFRLACINKYFQDS